MKIQIALTGGLAGAIALNLLHEAYRKIDADAPKIHLIGEEALVKILKSANLPQPKNDDQLYGATMAGDIVSNATYYALAGIGKSKNAVKRGFVLGLAAGVGAVFTPEKLGLNDAPSSRTTKTKVLTILWYTFGGVVAGSVIKRIKAKKVKSF